MPETVKYRAFNISYDKSVKELVSQIKIFPLLTKDRVARNVPVNVEALWDTGATVTCIKPALFSRLNLYPSDASNYVTLTGIGGEITANSTLVNLFLAPNFIIEYCSVYVADFPGEAEVLIGMDIIGIGDFVICNADNKSSFSFAIPSFPDRVNFADKAETANIKNII
jgi:hypothetical protein